MRMQGLTVGVFSFLVGTVALTEMSKRLVEDHSNARILAEGLAQTPHVAIDLPMVRFVSSFGTLVASTVNGVLSCCHVPIATPYPSHSAVERCNGSSV